MKDKNIIIFSSIDWDGNWQIHQKIALSLVKMGNKVLFIENTGTRNPKIKDYKRIQKRIKNWLNSTQGFKDLQNNLTIFSPIALPYPYLKVSRMINRWFLGSPLNKWIKITRFNNPIIIVFLCYIL